MLEDEKSKRPEGSAIARLIAYILGVLCGLLFRLLWLVLNA